MEMRAKFENPYETDYYSWLQAQHQLLKSQEFYKIDLENLLEEIQGLRFEIKSEFGENLTTLLANLIVWCYADNLQTRERKCDINLLRLELKSILKENASLKNHDTLYPTLRKSWEYATLRAAGEIDVDESEFPNECPWGFDELAEKDFFPKMFLSFPNNKENNKERLRL